MKYTCELAQPPLLLLTKGVLVVAVVSKDSSIYRVAKLHILGGVDEVHVHGFFIMVLCEEDASE